MTPLFDSESLPPYHERLEEGAVILAQRDGPRELTMTDALLIPAKWQISISHVTARAPELPPMKTARRTSRLRLSNSASQFPED